MNLINRYFKEHDPVWFSVIYAFVLIAFVIFIIYEPHVRQTAPRYFNLVAVFLLLGPIILTVFHINNYKNTISSMSRLISLYMQVVMMFGCIHFCSVAAHVVPQLNKIKKQVHMAPITLSPAPSDNSLKKPVVTTNISGISSKWLIMLSADNYPKNEIVAEALRSFYDSMHFSLMTSSTVGYGDMVPKTFWAKLMVDIQVLVSFFIIAFGVGSFFANSPKNEL